MNNYRLLVGGLLLGLTVQLQAGNRYDWNVPESVERCLQDKIASGAYKLDLRINPFYLRGDFDGDGSPDYAIHIRDCKEGKSGIAVCHGNSHSPIILGLEVGVLRASDGFVYREFDFGAWHVFDETQIPESEGEGSPPSPKGEPILILWPEATSGLIYWDGEKYSWYHQSY